MRMTEKASLLLALTMGLASMPLAAADGEREIRREWPAAGIDTLEIDANVGTVRLQGGEGDSISVELTIEPDDDWGRDDRLAKAIEEAELEERRSGDSLLLDLRTDGHGDDIQEHWVVKLPARLMAVVELNVGEADIRGVAGGVEAEVNVGELDIDVPGGEIDAEVNVGELSIRSESRSPGRIDLEVNMGDVDLDIDGKDIDRDSGWLGGSIDHDAGGDEDIRGRVNVGDLDVDID